MKNFKILSMIIIFNIIIGIVVSFFQNRVFAVNQTISSEINKINEKKYPGIKAMIEKLQKDHPKWNFKVMYTGLKWDDVIKGESGHGTNLVGANQSDYCGDWLCEKCVDKTYSGGKWLCASSEAIAYMMDPRNSLSYESIFQFLELSYDSKMTYSGDIIKTILKGSFLDDSNLDSYVKTIMEHSKKQNVNPYYIAGKMIQEQGRKGGSTFKMQDSETDKTYYNIFNIRATGATRAEINSNALNKAKNEGWDTIEKCLIGGIEFISNGYISVGQDTLYFEKFDVIADKYYSHQYAQDIMYAENQGTKIKSILKEINATEYGYTFVVPLYENMPSKPCGRPSTTRTSTQVVDTSSRSGINKEQFVVYEPGDIDNSKTIDAMDMYKMIQYILGNIKLDDSQKNAADMNDDGAIDAMDMYILIQKIRNS